MTLKEARTIYAYWQQLEADNAGQSTDWLAKKTAKHFVVTPGVVGQAIRICQNMEKAND